MVQTLLVHQNTEKLFLARFRFHDPPFHFNNGKPSPALNWRASPNMSTMPGKLEALPVIIVAPDVAHAQLPAKDALASALAEAWPETRNMRPVLLALEASPSPYPGPTALEECISRGWLPKSDIPGGLNCSRDGGARYFEPTLLREPSCCVVPRRATASFTRVITCAMSLRLLNIPQAMQKQLGLRLAYPTVGRRRVRQCTIHVCSPDGFHHPVRMVTASGSRHRRLTDGWCAFCVHAGVEIGDAVCLQQTGVPGVLNAYIDRRGGQGGEVSDKG